MPLFHHKSEEERKQEQELKALQAQHATDQTESLRRLEAGGIPVQAERRLTNLAQDPQHLFTGDLSVPEFLLARHQGIQPITQVMGSCFYHVGYSGLLTANLWSDSWEMTTITQAYDTARSRALDRLRQEAKLAGAAAVIGVRIKRAEYEWSGDMIEYTAIGTAVRIEGIPPSEEPVLTTFSGEDYWKLLQSGYGPVGVAAGTCVYYQAGWDTANMNQVWGGGWNNQELSDLTRGIRSARKIAQGHMHASAEELGAEGVVGVTITSRQRDREVETQNELKRLDIIFTYLMLGTAVAPLKHPFARAKVKATVNLSGRGGSRTTDRTP